jgi:hypothetical protein
MAMGKRVANFSELGLPRPTLPRPPKALTEAGQTETEREKFGQSLQLVTHFPTPTSQCTQAEYLPLLGPRDISRG